MHGADKHALFPEEVGMRADADQSKGIGVGLGVDQQQIRLDVTFAVIDPVPNQFMITVALWSMFTCVAKRASKSRCRGLAFTFRKARRKAVVCSISRIQVGQKFGDSREPGQPPRRTFPLAFLDGRTGLGVGNADSEGQGVFAGDTDQHKTDGIGDGQAHLCQNSGSRSFGCGQGGKENVGLIDGE